MVDQEQETPDVPEESEEQEPVITDLAAEVARLRKQNRELLKESKTAKQRARDAELARLQQQYPFIAPEDVEGLPASKLEAILAKAAQNAPPASQGQEGGSTGASQPDAEVASFVANAGSGTPAPIAPIPFRDLKAKVAAGEITQAQAVEMMRQGQVKTHFPVPGVKT